MEFGEPVLQFATHNLVLGAGGIELACSNTIVDLTVSDACFRDLTVS